MDEATAAERARLLDLAVNRAAMEGGRLVSRGQHEAVLEWGEKPNHILHLVLTILTCLLWALVWMFIAGRNPIRRRTVMVDEYGRTWISNAAKVEGWDAYPV